MIISAAIMKISYNARQKTSLKAKHNILIVMNLLSLISPVVLFLAHHLGSTVVLEKVFITHGVIQNQIDLVRYSGNDIKLLIEENGEDYQRFKSLMQDSV